ADLEAPAERAGRVVADPPPAVLVDEGDDAVRVDLLGDVEEPERRLAGRALEPLQLDEGGVARQLGRELVAVPAADLVLVAALDLQRRQVDEGPVPHRGSANQSAATTATAPRGSTAPQRRG